VKEIIILLWIKLPTWKNNNVVSHTNKRLLPGTFGPTSSACLTAIALYVRFREELEFSCESHQSGFVMELI
jgi:hypothetical protein